jgi:hypothetical protein
VKWHAGLDLRNTQSKRVIRSQKDHFRVQPTVPPVLLGFLSAAVQMAAANEISTI